MNFPVCSLVPANVEQRKGQSRADPAAEVIRIARMHLQNRAKVRPPVGKAFGADLICRRIGFRCNRIVGAAQVDRAGNGIQVAALHNV